MESLSLSDSITILEKMEVQMKLKNILIVTEDVERSKKFYKDLFGLEVVSDNDGNVILTEGLVLQDKNIWKSFLDREIIPENNASELYFEEKNIEAFAEMCIRDRACGISGRFHIF